MKKLNAFKKNAGTLLCLLCLTGLAFSAHAQKAKQNKYVVIGYVGGYKGLVDTEMVDASKLTHINYAFVDVQHNRAWLTHLKTDTTNFKNLVKLKSKNPDLKILISIGGWTWSTNFSDAVLSDTSRKAFAVSAVDIIRKYHLDGVDIDWEYPGLPGNKNPHRPEDKENFTLMFKELRLELNKMEKETGKKLLLTTAVGAFKSFLEHSEMDKAQSYLDYINLMTYDYSHDSLATHHTNLYASKKYQRKDDADKSVTEFIAAGVPANKLVMGLAFYGRSSKITVADQKEAGPDQKGLGMRSTQRLPGGGFTFLKDSLINKKGFRSYRDKEAKSPYLYNAETGQFISYDDEWSVKHKCEYVKKKGMGGVMFWEYGNDKKEYLLNQVNQSLK